MEKVVSLLWPMATDAEDDFARRLRGTTAQQLLEVGVEQLKICVTDAEVVRGAALHIGPSHPVAMVSWWTDASWQTQFTDSILDASSGRRASYLVCESVPLRYSGPTGASVRCEGFTTLSCIRPSPGMSMEMFRTRWFGGHCEVALRTQSTHSYVRNEVVRALSPESAPWAGIVEEMFPLGALDDPAVFFDAVGDPDRLSQHQSEMFQSVNSFIDLGTVESHPMSEYRY